MNDRLADLASHQVEVIDDVLDMVARDRFRVSALLEQAESPSLRQCLRDWLDAVNPLSPASIAPVRYTSNNTNDEEVSDEDVSIQRLEEQQNETEGHINSLEEANTRQEDQGLKKNIPSCDLEPQSHNSECCRENCWENYSRSFWDIYTRNPRCFRRYFRSVMKRHKQQRSRLAYGVPYQWVTEALDVRVNEFARSTGCFDLEDADHFFQGRDHINKDVMERILDQNDHTISALIDESYRSRVDENHFSRAIMIDEKDTVAMSSFFGDTNNNRSVLPTVDQVEEAGGTMLYDIIYFGMESRVRRVDSFRYGRTAKGSLTLSVTTAESSDDGTGTKYDYSQQQPPPPRIQGVVQMDPAMLPDMLPIGGEYSFAESRRKERLIWDRSSPAGGEACLSNTSVMDIIAFFPESEDKKHHSHPGVYHHASFATGEIRVISQRIPATLANEKSLCYRENVMGIGQADDCTQNYCKKKCCWMHRHTDLPKDVIQRIGDYVSPAPVFYLEQDDLVIDIDCTRNVRSDIHGVVAFSKTCVIARRR